MCFLLGSFSGDVNAATVLQCDHEKKGGDLLILILLHLSLRASGKVDLEHCNSGVACHVAR